jgi:hypothetical protein
MPRKRKLASTKSPASATDIGKARLLTLGDLDGRTVAAKRANALVAELENDLGGSEHLSASQRVLVRRTAAAVAVAEHLEALWIADHAIERHSAGLAIDHLPPRECTAQDRGGAAVCGSHRPVRHHREAAGALEILDIDDTFCAAHGAQQLAFWNGHHDERGFASTHIYHVASGTPVVTILRPARTPKGTEVRTVVKHVTKRLKRHWPNTRIVWRGDSHYGRVEAMDWAEDNETDYIFGLAGNAVLDALAAEIADNLRFHHAMSRKDKLRTFASFTYQATSWKRPRKVVARLECSLQPVAGETGMRQEVDIRYVVTRLGAAPLRERLLPARADGKPDQAAQGAALLGPHVVPQRDGQSGTPRTPHRCVLVDAWRARRDPSDKPARHRRVRDDPRAADQHWCARDRAHRAYSRPPANQLPGSGIVPNSSRTRLAPIRPVSCAAVCPDEPPTKADQTQRVAQRVASTPIQPVGPQVRARSTDGKNAPRHALLRLNRESEVHKASVLTVPVRSNPEVVPSEDKANFHFFHRPSATGDDARREYTELSATTPNLLLSESGNPPSLREAQSKRTPMHLNRHHDAAPRRGDHPLDAGIARRCDRLPLENAVAEIRHGEGRRRTQEGLIGPPSKPGATENSATTRDASTRSYRLRRPTAAE